MIYKKENFPRNLQEFIGNKKATTLLHHLITNKVDYQRPIPNILLFGPPGLGKTTLAQIIASETQQDFNMVLGGQVDPDRLVNILLENHGILFIDEIHSLSTEISEIFYHAIENRLYKHYDLLLDREVDFHIPIQTFIGATTDLGILPKPLIDRFQYKLRLQEYSLKELKKILQLYVTNLSLSMTGGYSKILHASQDTPRILKGLLYSCEDVRLATKEETISTKIVNQTLDLLDIKNSLNYNQQKYLELLAGLKNPIGIDAIGASLGVPKKDITYLIEPFLIRKGLILRTPRGRILRREK